MISSLQHIQRANNKAMRDILHYRAVGKPQIVSKLIRRRIELLGRETGLASEMRELEKRIHDGTDEALDQFYREHYELSRADAARLLDAAMQQEAAAHQFKPIRRGRP